MKYLHVQLSDVSCEKSSLSLCDTNVNSIRGNSLIVLWSHLKFFILYNYTIIVPSEIEKFTSHCDIVLCPFVI